ncbi:hypothetical protein ACFW2V_13855 [Streptomyces sp. NPDC058947]|uniref:hypothetical protein n=1 Tax=Streptomyces sp. NPDC058947 TaxID=3346675 RepID=UPI00368DCD1C
MSTNEPRLLGETEPCYSTYARDAFVEVLATGAILSREGLVTSKNPGRDFKDAFEAAERYCNDALLAHMRAFRDAVVDFSTGRVPEETVETAQRDFEHACRLALGTND